MSPTALLNQLRALDIQIRVEDDKLKVNAPRGALTPELKEQLGRHKKALIDLIQSAVADQVDAWNDSVPRIDRNRPIPLSFSQERLWFLYLMEPNSTAYNIPGTIRLKGRLEKKALQRTFDLLVERHETLRTTFQAFNGKPEQVIAEKAPVHIENVDLQFLPVTDREEEALRLAASEALKPFDLTTGPLFRVSLFQLSEDDHILHVNMHHIVSDHWSFGVISREFVSLYTSLYNGTVPELPELPIQYADFACFQRQWLKGEVLQEHLAYWKQKLGGELTALELPADRPRPKVQTHRGATRTLDIPLEQIEGLRALSRREGVSLFMTLLAAFKVLLFRHSGQEDIAVGTPIAGRDRTELEGLVGFFINTIVMRTTLSGNPGFRELLGRVRDTALGAYAHQAMPFERLVEELAPARDLSRTPVFQVFFNYLRVDDAPIQLPGMKVEMTGGIESESKFDLTLYAAEQTNAMRLTALYNADLFKAERIDALLLAFQTLLFNIVNNPDRKITDYGLLTDEQRRWIRERKNRVAPTNAFAFFPKHDIENSIASRFETQVETYPDKVAVKTFKHEWTFRHLNAMANRIANAILEKIDGRPMRIALLFEQDVQMVAAILGALKAGTAYVPLDPDYPIDRLRYMIADSDANLLLTNHLNSELAENLSINSVEIVNIDETASLSLDSENPKIGSGPDTLAYILYTSGSTGRPKGVMQNHRNVMHAIRVYTNALHITANDRLSLLSSYSFDAAVMDIYGALLNGATLYPVNLRDHGFSRLHHWFEDQHISIYHSTPTVYRTFIDSLHEDMTLSAIRLVVLGGEAVFKRDVDAYNRHFGPDCLFINGLGPTESTMALQYFIDHNGDFDRQRVPVGYAVEDTEVLLLNPQGRPDDIHGEIGIRSPHVALGYWHQDEKMQKAFLSDPEGGNRRIYLTGDLGRRLADGSIEFLGRNDAQVKIRGYRIETEEIETALLGHEQIYEAAVIARDINDQPNLVAYISFKDGYRADEMEVRDYLQAKLPAYMIPSAIVRLDALPFTPTKKIDRKALEGLEVDFSHTRSNRFVPAKTKTEKALVDIWCDILNITGIGAQDSFFELGGHSLLAARMISRIRQALDTDIPLRTLFEHPTVAELGAAIDRESEGSDALRLPEIKPVSRDRYLPLSFSQERLWFLHQLEPDSTAYSMPGNIRMKGRLNKDALQRTFDTLVERHETLRTTFALTDGQPEQVIADRFAVRIEVVDLRTIPPTERLDQAQRLANEASRRPFDLTTGPLLRATLYQLDEDDHILHVNLHHIVSDFWSFGVLNREFTAIYTAHATNQALKLKALPVQYADFAYCQRQWLKEEVLLAHLDYWKEKLGNQLAVLELPTDRPRPAVQTHNGALETMALPQELVGLLRSLSRKEGVSVFMVFLAVFKTLMFRLSGLTDIVIGTPIAGRSRLELEGLIGFFINTIVMRTDLSNNPGFRELLGRVRDTALEAYAHQSMPFEKLVEELAPARDLSRSPLFQVFFNYIRADHKEVRLPGVTVEMTGGIERESKFDMTLYVWEQEDGIRLTALYNTDLFDAVRIRLMLAQFAYLCEQIVQEPERGIAGYSLVPPAGQVPMPDPTARLGGQWNGAVHEHFSRQANESPERVAVTDASGSWRYGEVDDLSSRVAGCLAGSGVTAGSTVAVYGHRSAGLVTALLGVLKAGAAFLILDPDYPALRLISMLEAAGPVAWLRLEAAGDVPPDLEDAARALGLGDGLTIPGTPEAADKLLPVPAEPAQRSATMAEDKAYVIFTSGTSGRAKGVVTPHGPLSHFIQWHGRTFGLDSSDRFSMLSGLTHDPLMRDIFTPLCIGATLCVPSQNDLLMPDRLRQWMRESGITVAHMTPALGQVLTTGTGGPAAGQNGLDGLRKVFFGGDILTPGHVEKMRRIAPRAEYINFYGATETPQAMGYHRIDAHDTPEEAGSAVPVGTGIDDVQLLVLNSAGRLAGIGEAGEIHVRTPYLSSGYLDRALTADKFITNPFTGSEKDRLYRTGDIGRYAPDGTVMFHGRSDSQVSVRGFRVELKEVESVLNRCEGVADCAVTAQRAETGDTFLVAYVAGDAGVVGDSQALRRYLGGHLPGYMIPARFIALERIPLTPHGKVDLKALPAAVQPTINEQAQMYYPPRYPTEQALAQIWADVLERPLVGIYDSFFELGGHSLLAARMISRIHRELDTDIPLRTLFEHPTVADLAAAIDGKSQGAGLLRLPEVKPVSRKQRLPLSFSQERLWFLHQLEPETTAYSMPGSIRLRGRLDINALKQTYAEIVRRHETLHTTFQMHGGQPEQVISEDASLSVDVIDLRDLPEKKGEQRALQLADEATKQPFDLARGPLFRIAIYQLGEDHHVVHVNMHHMISDYWSFGIICREFVSLYASLAVGETPQLPALPIQYADFAYCQRQWLQGEVLEAHLGYWKEKLGGDLATLELPTDRARPQVQTHHGATESLDIPEAAAQRLRALSRREGVSLFMVLLAAFKLLLHRYAGQTDILVGTPIAGRNRTELEGLIGFFINTIVMRTDLSGDPGFRELLGRVRDTAFGAYAHQEMPFEKLVEQLAPARDLSRTPLFQVFFNHIRVDERRFELPGLEAEVIGGIERESKFDMTLYVWEREDGIRLTALYNTDLFDAVRIRLMLAQFAYLCEQIVQEPERGIAGYSLVPPAGQVPMPDPTARLGGQWNGAVHEHFSRQANESPERVAVTDASGSWRYGEVDDLSSRVAGCLAGSGVTAGSTVAVYGHRSAGLVTALLGVLKAGAAFLILDPDYPALRLISMLEAAGPVAWLRLEAAGDVPPDLEDAARALGLGDGLTIPGTPEAADKLLPVPAEPAQRSATMAEDKAYVIFTSGTSGRAKGVVTPHGPLSHFIQWHGRTFGLDSSDRFSMLSGLTHDPLMRDIFTPLCIGATLCVPSQNDLLMPDRLRQWMRESGITVAHMTPALGQVLTTGTGGPAAGQNGLDGLRKVFFGGDILTPGHVEKMRRIAPRAEYINFYGATETPQAMGYHRIDAHDTPEEAGSAVPVGTGIDDVQLLVLNSAGRLAGIGEAGEIHVRTPYLSSGYLDRALTADKFITNPFAGSEKDRLYRTGDIGRYAPDGTVMFHGRSDSQVSVRGFRVELKEVESVLNRCEGVADCAVTAQRAETGDTFLVAYVAGDAGVVGDSQALRRYLGGHLPGYMIPARFIALERIPLTPHGKVDLKALQVFGEENTRGQSNDLADTDQPVTEMEKLLAGIWRNVLNFDGISVHDNFFEIGGHSLLLMSVIENLEEETGLRVNPRLFFNQTLGQIANGLEMTPVPKQNALKEFRKMDELTESMENGLEQKRTLSQTLFKRLFRRR